MGAGGNPPVRDTETIGDAVRGLKCGWLPLSLGPLDGECIRARASFPDPTIQAGPANWPRLSFLPLKGLGQEKNEGGVVGIGLHRLSGGIGEGGRQGRQAGDQDGRQGDTTSALHS